MALTVMMGRVLLLITVALTVMMGRVLLWNTVALTVMMMEGYCS